jgi:hypothetical protein
MRLPYQPKEATMTDRIEATWNVETELGEPPYSQRHSLRVLLGRAVSMIAPSLTRGQSMDEADRMLRTALSATGAAAWQPIETAPKDGSEILVARPGGEFQSGGVDKDRWQRRAWWKSAGDNQPTHWQPLPAPPITPEPQS